MTSMELGKRERQIVEAVFRLKEASVADVLKELDSPPSYSAVRAMLGMLVQKKLLKQRQEGKRYLYRPAATVEKTSRSVLKNVLATFFSGQPDSVVAALLDVSDDVTPETLDRMQQLIDAARREAQQ
ncbi:MAG: BlaI/MecI/CopY family transcriptional regulator [Planctomycetaceae bacterium]|nr:BlaI/MecI/CopY family transcriptional regulator [Planctomycetaceae bacterium]